MSKTKEKDKKNAMVSLIESGESGITSTNHVLARLWRIILFSYGYKGNEWHRMIGRYQDRINRLSSDKGSPNTKGNMTRRLAEPKISWGTFLRGLSILEFPHIKFTVEVFKHGKWRGFTIAVHNDELTLMGNDDPEEVITLDQKIKANSDVVNKDDCRFFSNGGL